MRAIQLLAAAMMLGGLGGYGWSMIGAPAPHASVPRKGRTMALPASPAELPVGDDSAWAERSEDRPVAAASATAAAQSGVAYSGCNQVRAAGKAPLYAGQPGYREDMDGDGDGIACEPHLR